MSHVLPGQDGSPAKRGLEILPPSEAEPRSSCSWPHRHRHRAMTCTSRATGFGDHIRIKVEERHQSAKSSSVELTERVLDPASDLAEQRALKVDRRVPLPPPDLDAGITIRASDHPLSDAHHHPFAERRRHRQDKSFTKRRKRCHCPISSVLAGACRYEMVRGSFEAKKAQHRGQRRQPDSPFPEAGRVQPGFVEFQAHREQIRDALMQARDKQSAYGRVGHTLIWGTGLDPITPRARLCR